MITSPISPSRIPSTRPSPARPLLSPSFHPTNPQRAQTMTRTITQEISGRRAHDLSVNSASSKAIAAVDGDDLAGDAGAVVGREERRHAGELLGLEYPVLRVLGLGDRDGLLDRRAGAPGH